MATSPNQSPRPPTSPESGATEAADRYIARQLSDLSFNDRLLDLASDPSQPLLERAKFLALFSERIDEFFQVQVAGLKRQLAAGDRAAALDGSSPRELLEASHDALGRMVERQGAVLHDDLLPALRSEGIELLGWDDLDDEDRDHLGRQFDALILPVLTPLTVDASHPFPYISNLSLNVAVEVRGSTADETRFTRVKVPPNVPRLLELPGANRFVPVEDVIAARLSDLFPGMDVSEPVIFRVTRDADLTLEDDDPNDLLKALQEELQRRRFLPVVRLEIDSRTSDAMTKRLTQELGLEAIDVYASEGPLDLHCLWALHSIERPDLLDPPWSPVVPPALLDGEDPLDLFSVLDRGDVLVHHPYDSFASSVEALVRQAAEDPQVLAIKQCLYRTSGDSPIVAALVRAAERGKQVVVLIEVTARFDEEANIGWARALEEVGAHVVYGVMGLKTHSKTTLIVREVGGTVRRYCHVGTGNYNSRTARMYEDIGLLSARESLGQDLTGFFNFITGFCAPPPYHELSTSPGGIRDVVLQRIAEETAAGELGRIVLKVNGLDDQRIIDALYDASAAGVEIDLIIRGICCLRPGVPGLSEHIRVRSIVGRFLEHSRILRFGGKDDRPIHYYIGSADLRRRNLDRRVEAMVPIESPIARSHLEETLEVNLADDVQAWSLDPDGSWHRVTTERGIATQVVLQELTLARSASAGVAGMPST